MNIFEYATRNRLRFEYRGLITVEDLWSVKIEDLDEMYGKLSEEFEKVSARKSLLEQADEDDKTKVKRVKMEIIEHIVRTKLEEADTRNKAKEKKAEKQKLMQLIENKKNEALQNLSVEELQKKLAELE